MAILYRLCWWIHSSIPSSLCCKRDQWKNISAFLRNTYFHFAIYETKQGMVRTSYAEQDTVEKKKDPRPTVVGPFRVSNGKSGQQ